MAIAEQFAGLQMDKLIGAPLTAAADASVQLANSTADFINKVGFDGNGNLRTVAFGYQRRSVNEDGSSNLDEMKVDVPMLAIVPIPNLQVDEVNILFDMEVKQSEKSESSLDVGVQFNATAGFGPVKVSVSGNVSAHQANTRSSDNSAKYHVDVRATNHGIPEGLARVLDMMAANISPSLVGSTLKDGDGKDLTGASKAKAERLKGLRQEISQIETRLNAARGNLDSNITKFKKIATNQMNVYQAAMAGIQDATDKSPEEQAKYEQMSKVQGEVMDTWNILQNQAADTITMIADAKTDEDTSGLSKLFALKKLASKDKTTIAAAYDNSETYYDNLAAAQKNAVEAQKILDEVENELLAKKAEYSSVIAGKEQAAIVDNSQATKSSSGQVNNGEGSQTEPASN